MSNQPPQLPPLPALDVWTASTTIRMDECQRRMTAYATSAVQAALSSQAPADVLKLCKWLADTPHQSNSINELARNIALQSRQPAAPVAPVAAVPEVMRLIDTLVANINESHLSRLPGVRDACLQSADRAYNKIKVAIKASPTPPVQQAHSVDVGTFNQFAELNEQNAARVLQLEDEIEKLKAEATPPVQPDVQQRLFKLLNGAAGDGLIINDVDAADLFCDLFPEHVDGAAQAEGGK